MTIFEQAKRHAWIMGCVLIIAITFVMIIDRTIGHSTVAFGIAIIGLVIANARMLSFNCPKCGKNLFFRGVFVVPWPNRVCTKCGSKLDIERPKS